MELSGDQKKALSILTDWTNASIKRNQFITLGGYAGTGKTTLIAQLRAEIKKSKPNTKVAFASFTGKATRVMKNKLEESKTVEKNDSISTIHSLIYSPIVDNKEVIIGWKRKDELEGAGLIIIDEASMVDEIIWQDLLNYNVPIIAVGDHGQLPPIRGKFNLMENPEIKLEEIHRQARDNPIIDVSVMARENGSIPIQRYGAGVRKLSRQESTTGEEVEEILRNYDKEMLILCGYNNTRTKLNQYIRKSKEIESAEPEPGDRVICLRNNHKKGIYNGMLGTIYWIDKKNDDWYEAQIEMDGEKEMYEGLISRSQFGNKETMNFTEKRWMINKGDLFDFGYALTVHKAQGSQAQKVLLFEERFSQMSDDEWRRWLYTGVTRAEEELTIIG
ncbi:MAG TPA: AAA family ATPase [Patescibacteria group bacterium]